MSPLLTIGGRPLPTLGGRLSLRAMIGPFPSYQDCRSMRAAYTRRGRTTSDCFSWDLWSRDVEVSWLLPPRLPIPSGGYAFALLG